MFGRQAGRGICFGFCLRPVGGSCFPAELAERGQVMAWSEDHRHASGPEPVFSTNSCAVHRRRWAANECASMAARLGAYGIVLIEICYEERRLRRVR
jgi:hypothetical protein